MRSTHKTTQRMNTAIPSQSRLNSIQTHCNSDLKYISGVVQQSEPTSVFGWSLGYSLRHESRTTPQRSNECTRKIITISNATYFYAIPQPALCFSILRQLNQSGRFSHTALNSGTKVQLFISYVTLMKNVLIRRLLDHSVASKDVTFSLADFW